MELRVGLLGAGFIASTHVRALSAIPGVRIVSICDSDPKKAAALASTVPGAAASASLDEMLEGKPDAVHVLLPPDAHTAAAVACLSAGAHVLVEKPLATSTHDVRLLEAAAKAAGRQLGVNHNLVFNPAFRRLVDSIRRRQLGQLEHVSVIWNVPLRQLAAGQHASWMLRAPENILFEQAVHPLSMVQHLLGDLRASSVLPAGTRVLSHGAEFHETWQISLKLERGTAQVLLSFGREFQEVRLTALGQDGSASVDLKRNTVRLRRNGFHEPPLDGLFDGVAEGAALARDAASNFSRTMLGTLKLRPAYDPFLEAFRSSLSGFYDAIARGEAPPLGIREGAAVVEMCEVIGAAAARASRAFQEITR